ncbi:cell surface protein [Rhizobium redzepovicii]|uniref:cell surface protein n=1 Tax=Rhizobium redzepovicii TaxID=2867518 RepID=UPI002872101D|nr:cell surface protein [Rhizobium redzepovicii]MDR9779948.1 cell surface protein [Rhizobium redzepovicii]
MKTLRLTPSTTVLSAFLALASIASIAPAQAAPVQAVRPPDLQAVKMVQYKPHAGSWHGYQGFRTERPGTRRHSDGYWYPLAAFGVEAGTTGSIVRQPVNRPAAPEMCNPKFSGSIGPGSMPCDNGY